jgi:uncharacterized protein YkwD
VVGGDAPQRPLRHNPDLFTQMPLDLHYARENVGLTERKGAAALHRAWMASPSHRDAVLATDVDSVGIGVARGSDGRLWATTALGRHLPGHAPG